MPEIADLPIYQGDSFGIAVTVRQNGVPADITGWTAVAQIRRAVADSEPEVAAEMTAAVQSPEVLLSLTPAQTVTLSGRYVWDLELTDLAGSVTTVLMGKVNVTAEVTRQAA